MHKMRRKRKILRSKSVSKPESAASDEETITWSLRLPKSLDRELKLMAKREGRSKAKQVVQLLLHAAASDKESRPISSGNT
jgi:hypothetical protein